MEPIKNGLKCWLEGVDVTNSSTTWKDRSGNNNNFSITGSLATEKNMAVFSGSQYAKINNLNIEHGTIEITVAYDSEGKSPHGFGSWESNKYKFTFGVYSIRTRKKSDPLSGAGSWDFRTSQNIKYGDVATYGLSYNENTYSIFYNGKIIDKGVSSEIPSITSFYLGLKSDDNTKHAGKIKSLRIYNRKLEHHEILANYQYELLDRNNNLYVNNNNLPKIIEKLSDASNIKITGNKYGNRVQTVIDKIVEKADNVTKAINQEVVNNTHSFKVGKGNNVNVSTDVQDSFSEIAIKGQTYQNLILQDSMTKHTNVTIENDIVTLLDTYNNFEGITYKTLTKANTTYTVVFNVKEMFKNGIGYKIEINNGSYLYNSAAKLGINKIKITTKEDMTNPYVSILKTSTAVGTMKFSKNILLLEGDHTNNPNLPSYFEGIVGVGDKSKNLFNGKLEEGVLNETTGLPMNYNGRCRSVNYIEVDKNADYGIQIQNTETSRPWTTVFLYDSNKKYINNIQDSNGASNLIFNTNNAKYIKFKANVKVSSITEIQIKKGNLDTLYEPYYDGYKVEVKSNGKNLYDIHNDITLTYGISIIEEGIITTKTLTKYATFGLVDNIYSASNKIFDKSTKIMKGKKYSISCKVRRISGEGNLNYFAIFGFNKDENKYISSGITYGGITNINLSNDWLEFKYSNIAIDDFDTVCPCFQVQGSANNLVLQVKDIQIEESDASTSYEYFKLDKTEFLLDQPLMKLPNGVYDEITKDGKLIRRIGKIVLDGTGDIVNDFPPSQNTTIAFSVKQGIHLNIDNVSSISDKFINIDGNNYWNEDKEGFMSSSGNRFKFRIEKNKLESKDVVGLKKWLSQNPVTIYYQLSTPTVTELFVQCLRIFKDGYLTFSTLVAPESTHIVQLKKSAQIQNTIKQSQLLDNKITVLENNYDSLVLSTMSTLNDLELDYTLK